MIEQLESRRLLAVTATLVEGQLTVTGDAEGNRVAIGRSDAGIFVRAGDVTLRTDPVTSITKIKVDLLGGNDAVEIAQTIDKPSTILGGEGNDTLGGGGGRDSINGGAGNDILRGGNGIDMLFGSDGNDSLDGGPQADVLSGGGGIDTATYAARGDAVRVTLDNIANDGTPARTTTTGTIPAEGDNVKTDIERVNGGRGSDYLSAAPTVTATGTITPGRVTLEGGGGNDTLVGSSGGETSTTIPTSVLLGGDGNDSITGGSKNDVLNGGGGNDILKGLDGNDTFTGSTGADNMYGGGGSDLVTYPDRAIGIVVTMNDNLANDGTPSRTTAEGTIPAEGDNVHSDIERLSGTNGDDKITGNESANTIGGGNGNDVIFGNGGADVIEGSGGNDIIHGGTGNDSLYGGLGTDQLYGEDDNDSLYGRDGVKDTLDGGGGTEDRAQRDDLDLVLNVEFTIV